MINSEYWAAKQRNLVMVKPVEFIAYQAKWTRNQITKEVNDILDTRFSMPLKVHMISDEQAQEFVDKHYKWLCDSISQHEDDALEAETLWMTDWYISVIAQFCSDQTPV
jgi:hypothetical protein